MTQVSIRSLLVLNLYLSLAKSKRPELEKNFKGLVVPVTSVLWLNIITKQNFTTSFPM